jgi:hypothetical protein
MTLDPGKVTRALGGNVSGRSVPPSSVRRQLGLDPITV